MVFVEPGRCRSGNITVRSVWPRSEAIPARPQWMRYREAVERLEPRMPA